MGPGASVLLPEPLTDKDHTVLRELIDAVGGRDRHPIPDAFWFCDTRPAGGGYTGGGRPFAVATGLQQNREPDDLRQLATTFGFTLVDEILVVALYNGDEDHRILGELCVWLVERFGGVVDFNGALWPPVPSEAAIDILDADWRQVEPYFRRMVEGMPGRIEGLWYESQPGLVWVAHVGDAAFLRAWLEHPRFRMVK